MDLENEKTAHSTVQTQYTTPDGCHVHLHFNHQQQLCNYSISESIAKVLVLAALRQKEDEL